MAEPLGLEHGRGLCYTPGMSDTLTVRVPGREKQAWQRVAKAVGEELSEFARKPVRQRVQPVQARQGSHWDDLLGRAEVIGLNRSRLRSTRRI